MMSPTLAISGTLRHIWSAFLAAVGRLDKSLNPSDSFARVRAHKFTIRDSIYLFHIALWTFWIVLMDAPPFPYKLLIPALYILLIVIPFTSQFFLPALPVLTYLLSFFSNQFLPASSRPGISVMLLPTLESVLYGANISDILTRYTHPLLDILAWIPYGVVHYTLPFVVAALLWLFRPKQALHQWARIFGYMSLSGVITQILLPCSPPWYEIIYGLTPANYGMHGSPGGLARIDKLFGTHGYTSAFGNSPLVFGAFPSLHSGAGTMGALFISNFFPQATTFIWVYIAVLYWSTMYLTHHYLIDVVGGACLAIAFFYLMLPDELRGPLATASPSGLPSSGAYSRGRSKYEQYDLEEPRRTRGANSAIMRDAADYDLEELGPESDEEGQDITYRSPAVPSHPNFGPSQTSSAAAPLMKQGADGGDGKGKSHRHTASIASLIRADERGEDGWSPIAGSFNLPPGRV